MEVSVISISLFYACALKCLMAEIDRKEEALFEVKSYIGLAHCYKTLYRIHRRRVEAR